MSATAAEAPTEGTPATGRTIVDEGLRAASELGRAQCLSDAGLPCCALQRVLGDLGDVENEQHDLAAAPKLRPQVIQALAKRLDGFPFVESGRKVGRMDDRKDSVIRRVCWRSGCAGKGEGNAQRSADGRIAKDECAMETGKVACERIEHECPEASERERRRAVVGEVVRDEQILAEGVRRRPARINHWFQWRMPDVPLLPTMACQSRRHPSTRRAASMTDRPTR
jgi:hypothetical protein